MITELNDRFEGFVATEPRRAGSAGLFALASYASALGWLTESFAELTSSVDEICTRVGIPAEPRATIGTPTGRTDQDDEFDFAFNAIELEAVRNAAEAAGLRRTTTSRFSPSRCSPPPGSPTPAWRSPAACSMTPISSAK